MEHGAQNRAIRLDAPKGSIAPDTKCLTRCLIDRKGSLSITINITTLAVFVS